MASTDGFSIQSSATGDYAGESVSSAGDVNGDGIEDLIVSGSSTNGGEAYVIFGNLGAIRADIDLSALNVNDGFIIQNDVAGNSLVRSVSAAGDVNGDGIEDVIVGVPYSYAGGRLTGGAYVIFGQLGAERANIDLGNLTASDGFSIQGNEAGDRAGYSVSTAGDVNGDGIDDIIVGAPRGDNGDNYAGEAYVIFGHLGSTRAKIDLGTLSASDGFIIQGNEVNDYLGKNVSSAGDVNGDGIDDLILGVRYGDNGGTNAGQAYVIFGRSGATRTNIDLGDLSASDGFIIQGDAADDRAGISVASAGDVNGDGMDDMIVGAIGGGDGGTFAGAAYVLFGQLGATRAGIDLSNLAPVDGFVIQGAAQGDNAGFSVSSGGDVNDDGFDDLIVGVIGSDAGRAQAGEAVVIFGGLNIGNPFYFEGGDGNDSLASGLGDDSLEGWAGDDLIESGDGADTLSGGTGNDTLNGGLGNDSLIGGAGDDTYVMDGTVDVVFETTTMNSSTDAGGIDTVQSAVSFNLDAYAGIRLVENLELTGANNVNATGNALANKLTGNVGNNVLNGGLGNDTLVGGAGDDTYVVDVTGDIVFETTTTTSSIDTGGIDTVQSAVSLNLDFHAGVRFVENLILTGIGNLDGTGNALANRLTGNAGNNVLDAGLNNDTLIGGLGNDTLIGGEGDDFYLVDANGDRVFETTNVASTTDAGGVDTVQSAVGFNLDFHAGVRFVENLILAGIANVDGTGNALANRLTGNAGNNALDAGLNNDTLIGGAGDDTLIGGAGDDTYIVDAAGDVVFETTTTVSATDAGGVDTVQSSVSFNLDFHAGVRFVENLILAGTANVDGTGNALANRLTGNAGNNALDAGLNNDTLIGGLGNDTLIGGSGDDTYVVDAAGDLIFETTATSSEIDAGGIDTVHSAVTLNLDAYAGVRFVENLILTGTGTLNSTGNALANHLTGNAGNNVLNGGLGNDTLIGLAGNDTYVVDAVGDFVVEAATSGFDYVQASVSCSLTNNVENLYLTGSVDTDATGNALANQMTGNTGNNVLDGGLGNDTLIGGAGDDSYVVNASGDIVFETTTTISNVDSGGIDTVQSAVSFSLDASIGVRFIENLTLTGTGSLNGTGNALSNHLTGNAEINVLNGGLGNDTLIGLNGNDTYVVDAVGDLVVEALNSGIDTVQTSVTFALSDDVENLSLTGTGDINATGNALANRLIGNAGSNVLDGALGNDTLVGGAGNDTYFVDAAGDLVFETTTTGSTTDAGGIDTVQSAVSFSLNVSAGVRLVENLILTGAAETNGTGNALSNHLTGNVGNNVLNGGLGADVMIGLEGNDTYVVDTVGDLVIEAMTSGTDTVRASVSFTLTDNVENLELTGSASDAVGNALANLLTGTSGINVLDGGLGNDTLIGGAGDDVYVTDGSDTIIEAANGGNDRVFTSASLTLSDNLESLTLTGTAIIGTGNGLANHLNGNGSNNILDGGAGADTLSGEQGNDRYVTDGGDTIVETANAGIDTVLTSVSLTLGANLENLTLTGSNSIMGKGNELDNLLTGNVAANQLNGCIGADTLRGGLGDDTYVSDGGDVISETRNAGIDLVRSTASMILAANVENLTLTGNLAINGTGNVLKNALVGNSAANILDGGRGADILTGQGGGDAFVFSTLLAASNIDAVTDYNVSADTIWLDHQVFAGLSLGNLDASSFAANLTGKATDALQHIIYDIDNGGLYFDADGSGAISRIHFADIGAGLAMTNGEFWVI